MKEIKYRLTQMTSEEYQRQIDFLVNTLELDKKRVENVSFILGGKERKNKLDRETIRDLNYLEEAISHSIHGLQKHKGEER